MIEDALASYLEGYAGLTAIVGGKIIPLVLGDNAPPAVVFSRVDGMPDYTQSGASGYEVTLMQLQAWGSTYKQSKQVSAQLIAALSGFRGTWGSSTVEGVFINSRIDDFDPVDKTPREIMTIEIHHK